MSLGKGIAIAGIWLGVSICSLNTGEGATAMVALFALIATIVVADTD